MLPCGGSLGRRVKDMVEINRKWCPCSTINVWLWRNDQQLRKEGRPTISNRWNFEYSTMTWGIATVDEQKNRGIHRVVESFWNDKPKSALASLWVDAAHLHLRLSSPSMGMDRKPWSSLCVEQRKSPRQETSWWPSKTNMGYGPFRPPLVLLQPQMSNNGAAYVYGWSVAFETLPLAYYPKVYCAMCLQSTCWPQRPEASCLISRSTGEDDWSNHPYQICIATLNSIPATDSKSQHTTKEVIAQWFRCPNLLWCYPISCLCNSNRDWARQICQWPTSYSPTYKCLFLVQREAL